MRIVELRSRIETEPMFLCINVRKNSPRIRIMRLELDGALQAGAYLGVLLLIEQSLVMIVAKDAFISGKRLWRAALRFRQALFRNQTVVTGNDCRHLLRDMFLNVKQIGWNERIAIAF
jgi:hypothetical protein